MNDPHQHPPAEPDDIAMAELLDLDAEVLHTYHTELTAWLEQLTRNQLPRQILDLGSGTGTGTFALLERFLQADAIALDVSPQMLHRLRKRAHARGIATRVRTVQADLDAPWPALGTVDLACAASVLHHIADSGRFMREAFDALRPRGLLVISEMDFPRFLPDEIGLRRAGLEARIHDALLGQRPHDVAAQLLAAGFTLEAERPFAIDLQRPLPPAAGRYAQVALQRLRDHLDGQMDTADLTTLDTLLADDGPHSVLHRRDLTVCTTRTVWVARRP